MMTAILLGRNLESEGRRLGSVSNSGLPKLGLWQVSGLLCSLSFPAGLHW